MNRPFTPSDGGQRFRWRFSPGEGTLEFPLEDPGSAQAGQGILWFDTTPPFRHGIRWVYVSPSDVDRVDNNSQ